VGNDDTLPGGEILASGSKAATACADMELIDDMLVVLVTAGWRVLMLNGITPDGSGMTCRIFLGTCDQKNNQKLYQPIWFENKMGTQLISIQLLQGKWGSVPALPLLSVSLSRHCPHPHHQ
jgi:hypothetical protein